MKKLKFLLLFFILLFPLTACAQLFADQTQSGVRPAILVQYHVWYRGNHGCPDTGWFDWHGWINGPDDALYDPCTTRYGNSWLRQIAADVYPLIGTYKSGPEVYRWHIRLAKAAGIRGFLVSTFPGNPQSCGGYEHELRANFMAMLRVGHEENFKIGFEGWSPTCASVSTYYDTIRSQIDEAQASPYASALLKINGRTVYWIVTWFDFDTWTNITSNLLNTRDMFWIINGPQTQTQLNTARSSLSNNAQLTRTAQYNFPTTSGCGFHGSTFTGRLSDLAANSFVVMAHGYPGMSEWASERQLSDDRYCLWNNYDLLNDYLNGAQSGGAEYIILESWNDFTEWNNLEPAMDIKQYRDLGQETLYEGDPYRTLKQIAAWKGVTWQTPFLDCAIVDPLLQQHGVVQCGTPTTTPPNAPSALALK